MSREGVMSRANSRIPPTVGGGQYLDKDDLIRDQEPMGIKSVNFDSNGSQFGPRWVISVQPWFEDQDGPTGLLSFTNSPTREPVFEDLQVQIEENGNEPVGPVVLVKGKSQKGYRFYTFSDWSEDGEQEPAPVLPMPTQQVRPPKPAAVQATTETVPVGPNSFATAEKPKRRGRPAGSKNRTKDEVTPARAVAPARPASKPAERPVGGLDQPLSIGTAICPNCNQEVSGRVLPDEKGGRFIIHPHCPATNRPEVLAVTQEV